MLFCGLQADRPVVAWTNTDESLVAVVKSGPRGPGLDQLYTWWGHTPGRAGGADRGSRRSSPAEVIARTVL